MPELWHIFWRLLQGRESSLSLEWVPSHLPFEAVARGLISERAFLLNALADALASRAATESALPAHHAQRIAEVDAMVVAVQDRLIAIDSHVISTVGPHVHVHVVRKRGPREARMERLL